MTRATGEAIAMDARTKAMEALKPFSDAVTAAEEFGKQLGNPARADDDVAYLHIPFKAQPNFGDFRRAREALAALESAPSPPAAPPAGENAELVEQLRSEWNHPAADAIERLEAALATERERARRAEQEASDAE